MKPPEQKGMEVPIRPPTSIEGSPATMTDLEALRARIQELTERDWDVAAIEARFNRLCEEGIPRKPLPKVDPSQRQEIPSRASG
jgi:hypothetical protein